MPDVGRNFKFGKQLEAYLAGAFVVLQKEGKTVAAESLREARLPPLRMPLKSIPTTPLGG